MTKNLKRETESAVKQRIICNNLANAVVKSKEEIKKRNLKL